MAKASRWLRDRKPQRKEEEQAVISERPPYPDESLEEVRRKADVAERLVATLRGIVEAAGAVNRVQPEVLRLLDAQEVLTRLADNDGKHVIERFTTPQHQAIWAELGDLADRRMKEAQAVLSSAEVNQQAWRDLANQLARGWHLHVRTTTASKGVLLNPSGEQSIAELLQMLHKAADQAGVEALHRFITNFDHACTSVNLPLDRKQSRHPRYWLAKGFLELNINDVRGTATLSTYEGRLAELPADVEPVVELIAREHARLFDRPFDGLRMIERLRRHYVALLKKESHQDSNPIPIRTLTTRLGKNESGFRVDEFLVDLARLMERGPRDIEGMRLEFQHTKDTKSGILLPGYSDQGYIGYILFRKAGTL